MDFKPSEVQALTRGMVREFSEKEVRPRAEKTDQEALFPSDTLEKMAQLQILGLLAPSESGGAGVDTVTYAIVIEELARACASTAFVVEAHNSQCIFPIAAFGSDDQRGRFLPALSSGGTLGTLAVLESGAGLDLGDLKTIAAPDSDGFRLSGRKVFVPSAGRAGLFIVAARTDKGPSLFIVERGEGVAPGAPDDLLGVRGAGLASVAFNLHVPAENLLGAEGGAGKMLESVFALGSIALGAGAVGVSQAAIEASVEYSKLRVQFGSPIARFQAIQVMIADMAMQTESSRLLVYRAAFARDQDEDLRVMASLAKALAAESSVRVGNRAVQVHGGVGYTKEMPVERYYRDAMALAVMPHTPDAGRLAAAAELLK
ncbi:MAG: acyl-CoA dehydrogenase [Euryarchaeota archaeon]|nr:acyl-CoA dehydrogenase [Euryarchaeota archaeon]